MSPKKMIERAQTELAKRSITVLPRLDYYQGRHHMNLGSEAWNQSFRDRVKGVIDNQCKLAVNTIAEAVVPAVFKAPDDTGTVGEVLAAWASDFLLSTHANTVAQLIRDAEATGDQVIATVDVDDATGELGLFPLDAAYAHQSKGGAVLWAVFFWVNDETGFTHCTVLEPNRDLHYGSTTPSAMPAPDAFFLVEEIVHNEGQVNVAVVNKRGSVIDSIRPWNDMLNASMQRQFVAGEFAVLPVRVWFGIETYDASTGEITSPEMGSDVTGGSRDISIPTAKDAEGAQRAVEQLTSLNPGAFIEEQESARASCAQHASIPGFMLQLGGNPPSGDALEQAYMPYITAKAANERVYGPFFNRLATLAVRRYLRSIGVQSDAPALSTTFSTVATSTLTSRVEHMRTAVEAGMTLRDALVEFLGWSEEAADEVAGRAADQAADRAAQVVRVFDDGVYA